METKITTTDANAIEALQESEAREGYKPFEHPEEVLQFFFKPILQNGRGRYSTITGAAVVKVNPESTQITRLDVKIDRTWYTAVEAFEKFSVVIYSEPGFCETRPFGILA